MGNTLYTKLIWLINHEWTYCLSTCPKSGDSFMLIYAQFSPHSLFEQQGKRAFGLTALFYQSKESQHVPEGTQPWSHLPNTLNHCPNGPGQWNICDVKRVYSCLDILGIWLLPGIATKSSDFNLPSKDKKWFQEKPRWWTIEHSVH